MEYEKKGKLKKTIAFDFLGVLTKHDGNSFVSEEVYAQSEPNPDVIATMHTLKENGYKVIIHSTLADEIVMAYCLKHKVPIDEINNNSDYKTGNKGKPVAEVYVDDRALQYSGQSPEKLSEQIMNFKPHWK
ncbi:hypothetical protein MNBD_BACTEROID05-322 [hydrothermal vent metagenome]|uniref:Uncharacterized protein n=1 Tax=hydrothermal vent metagenome TaxID=652676 RepID=A0A3B0U246_9ZZZZ